MVGGYPIQAWLAWAVPLACSLLIPLVSRVGNRVRDWFAVMVGLVSSALAISMVPAVIGGPSADLRVSWFSTSHITVDAGVLVDPLSVLMASVAAGLGALILLYSVAYMAHEEGLDRYYFFMLLFIGAMVGLVMSDNLVQMFIFWEVIGLCSYALIGFWYERPSAVMAGTKAFIVTKVGDAFLLMGILYLYNYTHSFNLVDTQASLARDISLLPFFATAMLLMVGGAVGKSAQLPLHVWLPDAMEGPTPVSALIHAATLVNAGIYLVARWTHIFTSIGASASSSLYPWYLTVAWVGALTAFLAATMALVSLDLKKVLAYSTISQLGYMLSALGLGTSQGLLASQFHLLSHAVFKALLFLCAGSVMHATGTTDLRRMGGLRNHVRVTFWASVVGVAALSGIPPFSGFWSKELILTFDLEAGYTGIMILLAVTSAITSAYSLRWLYLIFFGDESGHVKGHPPHESPLAMTLPMVILASLSCVLALLEGPLAEFLKISHEGGASVSVMALSLSMLMFGGAPVYYLYNRDSDALDRFRVGFLGRIQRLFVSGYFFDQAYNMIFVNGVRGLSSVTLNHVEAVLERVPRFVADGAMRVSWGIYNYMDLGLDKLVHLTAEWTMRVSRLTYEGLDMGLDRLSQLVARGTVDQSRRIRRVHRGYLNEYVLASVIGFFAMFFLLVLTTRLGV